MDLAIQLRLSMRTSSRGANPVPYRRMPRTSPSACLNAVPRAIALSCVTRRDKYAKALPRWGIVLICGVVVVDVQVTLALHRERHAAVFGERMVHLQCDG